MLRTQYAPYAAYCPSYLYKEPFIMNLSLRRERFRAILSRQDCIHPASVFDPVSARIAQDVGFELGMFAGSYQGWIKEFPTA
jgi:hypothetical protein